MRTIPGALAAHMALPETTLATAWKLTYTDPVLGVTSIGVTTASEDAEISGVTYRATAGATPVAVQSQVGIVAGGSEFSGFFAVGTIVEADILAGKFDFADVHKFVYNWADPSMGIMTLLEGKVGEIRIEGRAYMFEVRELIDQLTLNIGKQLSVDCRANLGDPADCKVRLDPPTWAASTAYTLSNTNDAAIGSVVKPVTQNRRHFRCSTAGTSGGSEPSWNTTVGGTTSDGGAVWTTIQAKKVSGTVTSIGDAVRIFSDSNISEATNYWQYGKLTWSNGANQGVSMEIKSQSGDSGAQIELYLRMVRPIAFGDAYSMTAGCDKVKATCATKFGNIYNFRGEPDKPSSTTLLQYGRR